MAGEGCQNCNELSQKFDKVVVKDMEEELKQLMITAPVVSMADAESGDEDSYAYSSNNGLCNYTTFIKPPFYPKRLKPYSPQRDAESGDEDSNAYSSNNGLCNYTTFIKPPSHLLDHSPSMADNKAAESDHGLCNYTTFIKPYYPDPPSHLLPQRPFYPKRPRFVHNDEPSP